MFIDEAYSLGNSNCSDSFSKECIDTINQNLIDLEVSSIGLDEISAVINPQNAVLNEDERKETIDNLKEGGGKSDNDLVKIIDI